MSLGQWFGEGYHQKNQIKSWKQVEKFRSLWQWSLRLDHPRYQFIGRVK